MTSKLTIIEKVILLQEVDIFEYTPSEVLSDIAQITRQLTVDPEQILFSEGDISDSMYVVVEGQIKLFKGKSEIMTAGPKDVFGIWALFDDDPRVVTAHCAAPSTLLKVGKEEFVEILGENVQLIQGILKKMTKRLMNLMQRTQISKK